LGWWWQRGLSPLLGAGWWQQSPPLRLPSKMINLIFWIFFGTGLEGGPDPALGSGHSSCSCTRGHSGAGAAGGCPGAPACASLLGEKREDLGVSAAGRRLGGPFMPVLSLPHVCTWGFARCAHVCSHTGAGTCVCACSHTRVCVGTHVHIAWSCGSIDTQLCTRV